LYQYILQCLKSKTESVYFLQSICLDTYSPVPYTSYCSSFLQRILVLFEIISKIWYTLFSNVCLWIHIPLLSLFMMIDTSFSFLAQILPSYLLYSLIFSLLVFSYLLSFQKHKFTCGTLEKPISLQFYYFLFISNLLFLYYSFYLYHSFSFMFFLHLFFLSFFSFFFVFIILVFPTLASTTFHTS